MKHITLLHASEDARLAEQLERQLLHANKQLWIHHNNGASSGENIHTAWANRLNTSHLFIILVSADLTNSDKVMGYVQQAISAQPDRIIPVHLRICYLKEGRFEGYQVIPKKAVTDYSGSAKERAWLSIVQSILNELSTIDEPTGHTVPTPAPVQQSAPETPHRKFVRQREEPLPRPVFTEKLVVPIIETDAIEQEARALDVVVLFAPQDNAWLPPIERMFNSMQRHMKVRITIHYNPKQTREAVLDADLTLLLVSPDLLASDYIDLYQETRMILKTPGKEIIPVMIRQCQWNGAIATPRDTVIRKVSNDAAWEQVDQEIRAVLAKRYPTLFSSVQVNHY